MAAPEISIIMGSQSDWAVMQKAAEILDQFDIAYEKKIISAHRTPERLYAYAREAKARGLKIIIAGAGGAAHLPGMVAAITPLPVLAVPIQTKALSGMDSLLSIVQMPEGVPVASLAIDGAANAGLWAIRAIAAHNQDVAEKLAQWIAQQTGAVSDIPE